MVVLDFRSGLAIRVAVMLFDMRPETKDEFIYGEVGSFVEACGQTTGIGFPLSDNAGIFGVASGVPY